MKYNLRAVFCIIFSIFNLHAESVHKTVLKNGLTVLVRPTKNLQKVSTQLWVNVGSKHEKNHERGLAHWLEHMIFKGTTSMTEQDLWLATTKLSGSCNAATSYDYTQFYIDLPIQHWYESLPILADCMNNCTFKQDLMDAEVQVVIQELKMYKDHFGRTLLCNMISSIFQDHPYHYPIIGYKRDLKNLTRNALMSFYKKYYVPKNAVLTIVGNVDPQEAFQLVEKYFGPLAKKTNPSKQEFVHENDISSQSTTIYRNVQQPSVNLTYVVPGLKHSDPYIHDIFMLILTNMKQSRLKELLVDQQQLVNWVGSGNLELFDHDLFIITFEPKKYDDVSTIITHIQHEIDSIANNGIHDEELAAAMKQVESSYYSFLESNHEQASLIAKGYLARNDENFLFESFLMKDPEVVKAKVQEFAARYLRPWVMHKGYVLPLPEQEQKTWQMLQEESNKEDAEILADKKRQTELEAPKYSSTIEPKKPLDALIPQPDVMKLDNGLTVYTYHNPDVPKINIILKLKANHLYEDDAQRGTFNVLSAMLQEGTQHYSGAQLRKELSKHGISINISSGSVHMDIMKDDFQKAFELLEEILVRPSFNTTSLAKVKALILADIQRFWDDANGIAQLMVDDYFYAGHPFSKGSTGNTKTISRITQKDLFNFHKQYVSPDGAALIIVGNLEGFDIPTLIKQTIAHWKGPKVPDMQWPEIAPNTNNETSYQFEREQIILTLAQLSVDRNHPDFYKLLLFDLVFHEKLFPLRSQSGAFYTINGSLLNGSGKQPGLVYISANVSQTRVDEAENMIRTALPYIIDSFDEHDLEKAKLKLLNIPGELYSRNGSIADTFAFLHAQELPFDYFAERNKIIEPLSAYDVKQAVHNLVDPEKLITFKVGRLKAAVE